MDSDVSITARDEGAGPPRLVLRFAALTALGLGLATAAIVLLLRHDSAQQAQQHAIEHARFAADAVLAHDLRASDLASPLTAERRRQLNRLLRDKVVVDDVLSVSLYARNARLVHATEPGAAPPNAGERVRDALRGRVVSEISRDGARPLLRTYVPIVLGADRVRAVVAFEHDHAPIAAATNRTTWLVAGVLEGLLVVLFLLLAPVLARVTGRIRRHAGELERAATHDDLTGLPNRVWLLRAIHQRLAAGKRGALVVAEIKGFSEINQVFGSEAGDTLLREVAGRLAAELSKTAVVTHLGDDEFAILLDGSAWRLEVVAAEIRQQLDEPVVVNGTRLRVGVSLGGARLGEPAGSASEMVRRASAALAAAKEEGTDELRMFEPHHDEPLLSRAELTMELEDALERDELLVHFQPMADLTTRQIRGVEALVRWQHPTRGLLSAHEFIHEAEQSGRASDLRRFVLDAACRQWGEWRRLGMELELAVNLSPNDLHDTRLTEEIVDVLERYDMPPRWLILELTERTAVSDDEPVREAVANLSKMGVRLAVDDFGTGYSSLASLRRIPFHVVKLDRSLLMDVPGDPAAEAVVTGCITLAHALGAVVVAEGIEDDEQWAFVASAGCDIAQGYLSGRPASGDDVSAMLLRAPATTSALAV